MGERTWKGKPIFLAMDAVGQLLRREISEAKIMEVLDESVKIKDPFDGNVNLCVHKHSKDKLFALVYEEDNDKITVVASLMKKQTPKGGEDGEPH
jgi:hypothetical protein